MLTELEGGEQGVDAGERDVALAGEAPEGVEAALGVAQRVEDDAVDAVVALAAVGVGRGDAVAVEEEELHELAAVVLGGEDERRDVGRELGVVRARRLPERVRVAAHQPPLAHRPVARVPQDRLRDLHVAEVDRQQQRLAHPRAVRLGQQRLHHLRHIVSGVGVRE